MCYGCRISVHVAQGPDISQRATDMLVRVSPGRLAKSMPCIATGQLCLYLIYIVDKIACDSGMLVRESIVRAYMHLLINLLIGIHKIVSTALIV
jgi:hypothetical protein